MTTSAKLTTANCSPPSDKLDHLPQKRRDTCGDSEGEIFGGEGLAARHRRYHRFSVDLEPPLESGRRMIVSSIVVQLALSGPQ